MERVKAEIKDETIETFEDPPCMIQVRRRTYRNANGSLRKFVFVTLCRRKPDGGLGSILAVFPHDSPDDLKRKIHAMVDKAVDAAYKYVVDEVGKRAHEHIDKADDRTRIASVSEYRKTNKFRIGASRH